MSTRKEIGRGAEAILYEENDVVLKVRPKKAYRIPEIDDILRKKRTRQESRILAKLKAKGLPVPGVKDVSVDTFTMDKVSGVQVKEVLDSQPLLARKIGLLVAQVHDLDIIHGDLTTSNMILDAEGDVHLIDFGLGYQSKRLEDKAVDIHLFLRALESRHYRVKDEAYASFLEGYSSSLTAAAVLKKLGDVELRGRYKTKGSKKKKVIADG
jgi:Kae1-associated kinase Bud32